MYKRKAAEQSRNMNKIRYFNEGKLSYESKFMVE